ncbi:O-methyltransferase-domain-containing protein [Aspergillus coremiiformis]|uniref:O-methyltransferase-domain-containing protein n=1 Tax=Aspergillus coremiiformis TaxID=138285 RepID=A0A5N6ZF48_9EURO|nr:O-methyltransferase-domain-containing protein [Aspergillus coremiiformis]
MDTFTASPTLNKLATIISESVPILQGKTSENASDIRLKVVEACHRMLALVTSPAEMLKEMVLITESRILAGHQPLPDRLHRSLHWTDAHDRVGVPHSFFDPQPPFGRYADVFLLRYILHDWNDQDCRVILHALATGVKPGASILVAEQVLRSPGTVPWQRERVMRALDMQMTIQFGSKERTYDDWEAFFKSADPSPEIVACVHPARSADSFMELKKRA